MNYRSIEDLPIWNYTKILECGDFEKYGVLTLEDWLTIEEEFFNQIGFGEGYFNNLRSRAKIVQLKAKYYLSGDSFLKTLIRAEEDKLNIDAKPDSTNFSELVATVSKKMGFRVDPKVISVVEFYAYLKLKM